jgi:hypothetical protein
VSWFSCLHCLMMRCLPHPCSVSALVTTMTRRQDGEDAVFADCIKEEIEKLRKQLDKPDGKARMASAPPPLLPPVPTYSTQRHDHRSLTNTALEEDDQVNFTSLLNRLANIAVGRRTRAHEAPIIPLDGHGDVQALVDAMAANAGN